MKNTDKSIGFGTHPLDHIVGFVESVDLYVSESKDATNIQAWQISTIGTISSSGGCVGCVSSIMPD